MNLKPCKDAQFSQVNSTVSALTINIHTTDGSQSLCSVISAQIQLELGRAQEDFPTLAIHLRELAPDHTIFDELSFLDEVIDELESLGSQRSQKMHEWYKETRNNSMLLCLAINAMEQSSSMPPQNPPPNSGSVAPPTPQSI
jgi:hypothetical protein